jgi:prepilin-type N-terminal cleavage/methylation domain-containing protein/prepilin-type processing-associated H-X9-DG protein
VIQAFCERRPERSTPRGGFTVPEVLAVVAIIVIILSILMPNLTRARARARAVICSSNEHQLGVAVRGYAVDNRQYFPVGVNPGSGDWLWMAILRDQMAGEMDLFYCPTAPAFTQWKPRNSPGSPSHPTGWKQDERRLGPGRGDSFSYGMNVWGAPCCADAYGTGTYYGHATLGERKINTVVAPSNFIVLGDSNWDTTTGGDSDWAAYIGMYAARQYPMEIHDGYANILRADGHVDQSPRSKLVTFSADAEILRQWHRDNLPHWPL